MKFKETMLGRIPSTWEIAPIKEVTDTVTDYVANGSFASLAENVIYEDEEDVAVLIRLVDFNRNFKGDFVFIDEHAYEFLKKSKLYGGEIIISNVGANVGTVFRCPFLPYKMSLAPNAIMVKFMGNDDFYFHWLRCNSGQQMLKSIVTGSAQPKFNKTNFREMIVPVPPIEIQNRIASILNTIDEKIELNDAINENLQQQVQAVFSDWLTKHIEDSDEVSLGEICSKVTDGSHFSPKDDPTSTIPMLSVKDMREFDFNLISCKHISKVDYQKMIANDCVPQINDILVAKDGSYLKEIFICNEERQLAILSSIAIFRPDTSKICPEILLAFLKSPRVLQEVRDNYVSGSALPRIVLKDFKKLRFLLPNMTAQSEISELLSAIRLQIVANEAEINRLAQLRDALLQKLMSGELDVSDISI